MLVHVFVPHGTDVIIMLLPAAPPVPAGVEPETPPEPPTPLVPAPPPLLPAESSSSSAPHPASARAAQTVNAQRYFVIAPFLLQKRFAFRPTPRSSATSSVVQ
jgi:hypothetical protein